MAVAIDEILDDLVQESESLSAVLAPLAQEQWDLPTPALGWAIRDQVSHLAYFDQTTALAITDEQQFRASAEAAMARAADFADALAADFRAMPPEELFAWFKAARSNLVTTFRGCDPARRVPWYGLPMSAASSATARLMETWAHGRDVTDALGISREPTARLRHIAHLGVRTLPFSFAVRGLPAPAEPVRIELAAPGGGTWSWGDSETNQVTGDAEDFCLVVTQRRNIADAGLTVRGPVAVQWMSIAQAFAGPASAGRAPGAAR